MTTRNTDRPPELPKNLCVLLFAEISWDGLYQRPHHIARALAEQCTVLWVEPATLASRGPSVPRKIDRNLYAMTLPTIPYNARFRPLRIAAQLLSHVAPLRALLEAIQRSKLRAALRSLGAGADTVKVAVVHHYPIHNVIRRLGPAFYLYDYIDYAFGFTGLPEHLKRTWKRTVEDADLVTATSRTLERQIRAIRKGRVEYVGNGVDYRLFSEAPSGSATDLDLPATPVIGYIGAVYPWLDYALLEEICVAMPEATLLMVGPVHPESRARIDALKRFPNFRSIGFRPYAQIPSILRRIDVCIIPFLRNELTMAVNPVKLYEYSAAGKPAVSTFYSDEVKDLSPLLHVAESPGDFVPLLRAALASAADPAVQESLKAFARGHDWSARCGRIIDLIAESGIPIREG